MVDQADGRVALLSIHPRFADAILRGEKRVEFRRRGPSADTTHVIVYATAPVQRVVGWFRVGRIDQDDPFQLWERFGDVGAIERAEYAEYYEGAAVGSAITVAEYWELTNPLSLADLPVHGTPPQSFRYVSGATLDLLQRHQRCATAPVSA